MGEGGTRFISIWNVRAEPRRTRAKSFKRECLRVLSGSGEGKTLKGGMRIGIQERTPGGS